MVKNEDDQKEDAKTTTVTNGLTKNLLNTIECLQNITVLDLSNKKLSNFSEDLKLPPNIVHLNVSRNQLTEVSTTLLNLDNLQTLDLSYNSIVFFDDPPNFCHTLIQLNLSHNQLEGPPLWVWAEKPKNLLQLNLSNNKNLCKSLTKGYFEELLNYTTLVKDIDVHNCKLSRHVKLMMTFCHAAVISLGHKDYDHNSVNYIDHVPCEGLEECCDIEKLDVSNMQIYEIKSNINVYKDLKELNLAQNYIHSLPDEFSNLGNLHTCILSGNKLLYLPDNINKLTKLVKLCLDNNELCMLPESIHEMHSLEILDLYDNNLCEGLHTEMNLKELDVALNYFEEPTTHEYLVKKVQLRLCCQDRVDGKKMEMVRDDSEYSGDQETDDEDLYELSVNRPSLEDARSRVSSPEDWDSDEYWIPQYYKAVTPPRSPWLYFVKKKMEEGNFCPMDAHTVSISDKVKYEKLCNPQTVHESDGQFDDYSDDDS